MYPHPLALHSSIVQLRRDKYTSRSRVILHFHSPLIYHVWMLAPSHIEITCIHVCTINKATPCTHSCTIYIKPRQLYHVGTLHPRALRAAAFTSALYINSPQLLIKTVSIWTPCLTHHHFIGGFASGRKRRNYKCIRSAEGRRGE